MASPGSRGPSPRPPKPAPKLCDWEGHPTSLSASSDAASRGRRASGPASRPCPRLMKNSVSATAHPTTSPGDRLEASQE